MKRLFKIGKRRKAFSMAEMLVVMLILAIVLIAATPVAVRRVKKDSVRPEHGSFECYWDGDKLYQVERNAMGVAIKSSDTDEFGRLDRTEQGYCDYQPRRGAMFFTINAVGGGSPGTGVSSLFNSLPNSGNGQGTDYTMNYYKYNSFLTSPYDRNDTRFEFEDDDTFGDSSNSPLEWLRSSGLKLYTVLRSKGGDFADNYESPCNGGAAYITQTASQNSLCDNVSDDMTDADYNESKKQYEKKVSGRAWNWATYRYENVTETCYTRKVFPGRDPAKGKAIKMETTLTHRGPFKSTSFAGNVEPYFLAGNKGCKVTRGGDGVFTNGWNTCGASASATVSNYGGTCSYNSVPGLDYDPNRKTVTTYKLDDVWKDVLKGIWMGKDCEWDVEENRFKMSVSPDNPNGDCKPGREDRAISISKDLDANWKYWYSYTFGTFALARQKFLNGINFYAQAGSPGEYRALYVSRFKRHVAIYPGKYEKAADVAKAGNPTLICYPAADNSCNGEGAEMLLTVPGGKKPYLADSNTFIMGSIFQLDNTGVPIAYDNDRGDNSGEVYGNYFKEKDSSFMYPIPDVDHPIPSTVGQGGHGAYTIYRLTGSPNYYEMYSVDVSQTNGYSYRSSSSTSGQSQIEAEYPCVRNWVSGTPASLTDYSQGSHRCFAGDGFGGAVVLTW